MSSMRCIHRIRYESFVYSISDDVSSQMADYDYLQSTCVLATTNAETMEINDYVIFLTEILIYVNLSGTG